MPTAQNLNPFESTGPTGPYTPGLNDFGGAQAVNLNGVPPTDPTWADANDDNNQSRVCVSLAAVAFVARVQINVSGTFGIESIESSNTNVNIGNLGTYGITAGHVTTGKVYLEYNTPGTSTSPWPAPKGRPEVAVTDLSTFAVAIAYFDPANANPGKTRITIWIQTPAGAFVNADVQVRVP